MRDFESSTVIDSITTGFKFQLEFRTLKIPYKFITAYKDTVLASDLVVSHR